MACSFTPNELKVAEQQMETAPDSSLKILKKLQPQNINGAYNNALYALLMSEALEKNENKIESDSLISIATDYFDASDPVHAGYAWFYHARTANNRDSVSEQANNLLKAQEYAVKINDNKLMGLIYGDKGTMYKTQRQVDSSICYFKLAYQSFKAINDSRNCIISLLNLGTQYLKVPNFDNAINSYTLAEKMAEHSNDTLIISTIYRCLGSVYLKQEPTVSVS